MIIDRAQVYTHKYSLSSYLLSDRRNFKIFELFDGQNSTFNSTLGNNDRYIM